MSSLLSPLTEVHLRSSRTRHDGLLSNQKECKTSGHAELFTSLSGHKWKQESLWWFKTTMPEKGNWHAPWEFGKVHLQKKNCEPAAFVFYNMLDFTTNNSFILMQKRVTENREKNSSKPWLFSWLLHMLKVGWKMWNTTVCKCSCWSGRCLSHRYLCSHSAPPAKCTKCEVGDKDTTRTIYETYNRGICPAHRVLVKSCKCSNCAWCANCLTDYSVLSRKNTTNFEFI